MAYVVIYNPLSKEGKKEKTFRKLAKILKTNYEDLVCHSIINLHDIHQFFQMFTQEDSFILVGGDGTINRFANLLGKQTVQQHIYLYQAGTGNDFARSMKTKKKLIPLMHEFLNLPSVKINDYEEKSFINGVGIGVDGMVCYYVNHHKGTKSKINYFRQAIKAFKKSKRFQAIIQIDDKLIEHNKVWLVSVMHSKYFGGGMPIAPKAKRSDDTLTIVCIKGLPKWLLVVIFPTIYLGIHVIFKRWVKFYHAKHVEIRTNNDLHAQIDGDDYTLVDKIIVKR